MKASINKLLRKMHLRKPSEVAGRGVVPKGASSTTHAKATAARKGNTPTVAGASAKPVAKKSVRRAQGSAERAHARKAHKAVVTGETLFDDRPLRFRSLTLNEADLAELENSVEIKGGFKIRIARQSRGRRHAGTLVDKQYAGRGYTTSNAGADARLSTFIAYDEGILVGTVSVRLDSPAGLSADELYRTEIDALRAGGARLCEFTRLAVDRTVASMPVLAGLFHTAYLYAAVIRGCTHAIIEVNPRHVSFYRKALDFELIGEERLNLRVHAPAVLLCVPFAAIAEGLRFQAGKATAGRSLFPYGFPPGDEAGVLSRLRTLVSST